MPRHLPSGRVTFVFVDVVGSTRLLARHREDFVAALGVLQEAVEHHTISRSGTVVKTEGDGAFLAFGSASDAVAAMVALQDDLRLGRMFAGLPWLSVRVGAHTGAAVPVGEDYVAFAVNVAARVSAAAGPAQVLVSQAVVDDLPADEQLAARELGAFVLKDVEDPVVLWRMCGDDAPPRAAPVRRTNVAETRTTFFGRADDLAALRETVATHRLVSVVGTGGLGKTRLVSQYTLACCEDFTFGVWLAELASIDAPEGLAGSIAEALGIDGADDLSAVVTQVNRRGELLLVLDNCEHLLDAVADTVAQLLARCPDLKVVCTSREPLLLDEERVLRPEPLATDEAGPAAELFADRAAQNGVEIDARDSAIVTEICKLYDGLPLAIELAAAQSSVLPLPELASALADRTIELRRRGVVDRQANLDNLVQWSFSLLAPAELEAVLTLSVFPARFGFDAARTVLSGVVGDSPVDAMVDRLVHKSLIDLDGPNLRLLWTIRETARAELAARPDLYARAHDALLSWAQAFASDAFRAGSHSIARDDALTLEQALHDGFSRDARPLGPLMHIVGAWSAAHGFSSHLRDLARTVASSVAVQSEDDVVLVRCAINQLCLLGGYGRYVDRLELARDTAETAQAWREVVFLELGIANALVDADDLPGALDAVTRAHSAYERGGEDSALKVALLITEAQMHCLSGDHQAGLRFHRRARAVDAESGDFEREVTLLNLGECCVDVGNYEEAEGVLSECLRVSDNPIMRGYALACLSRAVFEAGRIDLAVSCARASLEMLESDADLGADEWTRQAADRARSVLDLAGARTPGT